MEISDLMLSLVQNHDRILPETIEKDDQVWKYVLFSTNAGKFLIKRQGDSTRHNRAMPHLGNSDRELSHCRWIEQIEKDRGFGLLS
jgi:hypothetical protein